MRTAYASSTGQQSHAICRSILPCGILLLILPSDPFHLFLLGTQARGANVSAPQLDVEHSLHLGENGLVRRSSTTLVCSDGCCCLANLLAQLGLGHSGLELLTGLLDSLSDFLSDGLGLDNVIGAVDLGKTLAFAATTLEAYC